MARDSYQEKLDTLRDDVLYMSEVVTDRLRMALEAMAQKDDDAAWQVIDGDDEINQLYLDLEDDCIDLLALQQPVAGDLRLIASSFKIITDLERIGDLAANLAEYTLDADRDMFPEVDVQAIGDRTIEMVTDAMAAYASADVEACYAIAERDDDIDERCRSASQTVIRDLIETEIDAATDDAEIEALMQDVSRLLLTVRDLERVGDHAVNISARTVYMVDNDDELIY
ncbi:phosphate signaling complex protein PhoU [Halobacterium salinarum]|uniref:phosphate signaling complex protein PhoU n=1 Tax=Halobacterium salinarum TaxID=2242 RepID=UPI001F284655|nr:phosphate signaling complex protein PhoU [Halobacterium salinarum]MCF2207677.1 phosphate signaling complex protein PhoU [Halobacterium salinarum]MCF2239190.1 phosphate signaling complex protein PhoU [Halobacterium salinarum]MCF2241759.1 phosphate signaling complex protein PhoU [Halobacterium salinarum]